jgi:hypothetical protein
MNNNNKLKQTDLSLSLAKKSARHGLVLGDLPGKNNSDAKINHLTRTPQDTCF